MRVGVDPGMIPSSSSASASNKSRASDFINESRNSSKDISTDLRKSVNDHFTILACCQFWNHPMMRQILFLLCKIFSFFRRNTSG